MSDPNPKSAKASARAPDGKASDPQGHGQSRRSAPEAKANPHAVQASATARPGAVLAAPVTPDKTAQRGKSEPSSLDVVIAVGKTADQRGLQVLRARASGIEAGEVRPLEEGKPIQGEVVRLKPREGAPHLCDVETLVETPRHRQTPGPAQVASDAYRRNWDAIWQRNSPGSSELN